MNTTTAIILLLKSTGEPIKGRTLLQKRLYFFGILTGSDLGFSPHYYGPYSSRISEDLDALVAAGLVTETKSPTGLVNELGPSIRYDIELDDRAHELEWVDGDTAEEAQATFERISDHDVAQSISLLSAAAKVHFIVSGESRIGVSEVRTRAATLGWTLSRNQISQVVEYLEHLSLVTRARKRRSN